jgi:DNA-binding PadR family transcriptional regulator
VIYKELKIMDLNESNIQTEKIQSNILNILKTLRESEGYTTIDVSDMEQYGALKGLAEDGFVEKNALQFKITESGLALLESIEAYVENAKIDLTESTVIDLQEKAQFEEAYANRDVISITYMRSSPHQENIIESATAQFEKETDGLPIIPVNEESYKGIINRQPGQHWRRYVGEAGRKLIRDKKLERVYIQNESTGYKYLYCIPKK